MAIGKYIVQGVFAAAFLIASSYGLSRTGAFVWPPHYDPLALPDLNEPPYWLTQTRLKLVDANFENCQVALNRAGMNLPHSLLKAAGTTCALDDAVQLSHLGAVKIRTEDMRCNIAARLYMWQRNVVEREAMRQFGEGIAEVTHFGAYSCRTIRGSKYMSEHATANAFDISGFKLKSGKTISVLKDWNNGPKSNFLHAVHDGLCDYFNLTLSPDYNADHKDHFHVDMGWVRGCR